MPPARAGDARRATPRGPLVLDTRGLGPGSARTEHRAVPAPAEMGSGMVGVPPGASMDFDIQLEGVSEGVLATVTVSAPLAGECARCLEPFTSSVTVRFQELFSRDGDAAGQDGYELTGDLLDLEPALRDALVLELPLSPLCDPGCPGLCPECGVRLADAAPGHDHGGAGAGVWEALRGLGAPGDDGAGGGTVAGGGRQD